MELLEAIILVPSMVTEPYVVIKCDELLLLKQCEAMLADDFDNPTCCNVFDGAFTHVYIADALFDGALYVWWRPEGMWVIKQFPKLLQLFAQMDILLWIRFGNAMVPYPLGDEPLALVASPDLQRNILLFFEVVSCG